MAVNSLLYLLFTSALTAPPDQSVITESSLEYTRRPSYGPTDDTTQWHEQTKWPGYGGEPEDATIRWRQEPPYSTEYPSHQYTAPPVTENENDDRTILPFQQQEDRTYQPHEQPLATEEPQQETERYGDWSLATEEPQQETERYRYWPLATEEPQQETERYGKWSLATEEPENETERPEARPHKKGKRRCPPREHFSKCHKNCEKTCSDYMKPKPCPRSCKKGCVCDGGLVRNKEGRCVPRDQCQKKLMAEDDNSHGCPYEYACDVYCVRQGHSSGQCEGNTCKCSNR